MWHYLTMRSRLVLIVVSTILGFGFSTILTFGVSTTLGRGGVAPAAASNTKAPHAAGTATTPPATQSPGTGEVGEGSQPNVGDETPKGMEIDERHNLLTDESGLIAIGLAALIGATTAILVMRNRRKHAIY
jgi:hypothetical protein